MEKEISSGAMLGIVLIALAAVIGLGFGVFAIAKSTANDGIVGVQDSLNQVSDSTFNDYDQKTVTGAQVKSFVTTMAGKPYAMLVGTQAMQKEGTLGVNSALLKLQDVEGCTIFANYNALISVGGTAPAVPTNSIAGAPVDPDSAIDMVALLPLANGVFSSVSEGEGAAEVSLDIVDGTTKIAFANEISGLTTTGAAECVTDASKFKANLIKDTAGTIKGVVFAQIKKN